MVNSIFSKHYLRPRWGILGNDNAIVTEELQEGYAA